MPVTQVVRHEIEDYDAFRAVFDENAKDLARFGCLGGRVHRSIDDPNEVFVVLSWEDAAGPERFAEHSAAASMEEVWQRATVKDAEGWLLDEGEPVTL